MNIDLKELKTITLLYVEDDDILRTQTLNIFEKVFKQTLIATNGEEGLNLFNEYKDELDIIVTDLNMPKMNGLKMAEEIHKVSKTIPIIFTTAYTDEESLLKAISLNVDSYITKPVKIKDLTNSILTSVKKYRENKNLYKTTKALANEMITTKKDYDQLKEEFDFNKRKLEFYMFLSEHFIPCIKLDNLGIITDISNQFKNIYKYKTEDLRGKQIHSLTNNASNIQKKMLESLKNKEPIEFEESFITADNQEIKFNNIIYPLYENNDLYASGYIIYQALDM
ncbi:response regulator [Arcobacter sp. CECT 8985]|uniref:ATP-binding response regulator n=1 Tax=Arcobacter sp. CECT 8985 TaxID=1935424 RepID=UPI00100AD04E|nr:response regulator [Arcobacter sp. CECT 8985]RXJ87958.1 hypothetical protein CRU93_02140 [Arcobacter sp. CECT 8985]